MVDNVNITEGSGKVIGADEVVDGTLGTVTVQYVKIMDGALDGTTKLGVDASGILVNLGANNDVTVTGTVTANLAAGTNNIGDVDIASALPAGDNNIGNVDVVTLPALPAGTNNIGDVDVLTLPALPAGTNNIGDVDIASALPAGTNNIGDVDIASALPAGENVVGAVVGETTTFEVDMTNTTTAIADGDVIADTQILTAICRANDRPVTLQTITVLVKDDINSPLNLFFLNAATSLGTENAAISISDADAEDILAVVPIATADFHDLIGSQVAFVRNLSIPLQPAAGSDDLYLAIQGGAGNTSTYAGTDSIHVKLGIFQD